MLISGVQQSDSVISIYIFIFFSIRVYDKILNIVACAIQSDLVIYPFYKQYFVYLLIPNS